MATITSVSSGNWSAPGTWDTGVPADGDDVVIADPWTGTIGKLSEMYPKPVLRYGSYRRN